MKNRTKKKSKPKYKPLKLHLPYSYGLLLHYDFIHAKADGFEILNAMNRLIRQRVISQNRKRGLCVSQILATLSCSQLKKVRAAVLK